MEKQKTLKAPVSLSGVGLHSGKNVTLTFAPAPINHGIKYKRIDLEGNPVINVDVDYVVDTSRGTTIEFNGVRVGTAEHALAALIGMGIDNVIIEINAEEAPILDGSSRYYVEAIEKTGTIEQEAEREYIEIDTILHYQNGDAKVEMIALPHSHYKLTTMIDYELDVLGTQNATLERIEDFKTELSACRTFVFLHEIEYLFTKDHLIKGGDLQNAIVFVDRHVSQQELDRLAELFDKPKIEVRKEGILNNLELNYPNEPARHKMLDVIGDLALLGKPIKGHIISNRPGHHSNIEFAKIIRDHVKKKKIKEKIPSFDLTNTPVYDINQIKGMLPHRYPFLLVDKIIDIGESHVTGVKNVTYNESFFVGHFPSEPLMPGVLQIEAMAQAGGILILSTVPDPENYVTYFLKIENTKFRQKVVPGDTLVLHLELLSPIRRGLCHMKGIGYVGNKIVLETELMAQIVKK